MRFVRFSAAVLATGLLAGSGALRAQERSVPVQSERVTCSIAAALKYGLPANLVLAVAELEGGKPGQWVENTNHTFDVGAMQFNTRYLHELARYGITASDVAAAGCYPYDLATWRLARHIVHDQGDLWQRAANYHSRTPKHNATYRQGLRKRAARWAAWLKKRFATREFETGHVAVIETATPPFAPAAARARSTMAATSRRATATRTSRQAPTQWDPGRPQTTAAAAWVRAPGARLTAVELRALQAEQAQFLARP